MEIPEESDSRGAGGARIVFKAEIRPVQDVKTEKRIKSGKSPKCRLRLCTIFGYLSIVERIEQGKLDQVDTLVIQENSPNPVNFCNAGVCL